MADVWQARRPPGGTITVVCSVVVEQGLASPGVAPRHLDVPATVHQRIVQWLTAKHAGRRLESADDVVAVGFSTVEMGLAYVSDVMAAAAAYADSYPAGGLVVGAGVHVAEAVTGDGGVAVDGHVSVCSTIARHARGAEVLVSSLVRDQLDRSATFSLVEARTIALARGGGEFLVHKVLW